MADSDKKILFFTYNANGLMHNAVFDSFTAAYENMCQLIEEENLILKNEYIPTKYELISLINRDDDYHKVLSNGTWFHIQEYPVSG